MLNGTTVSDYVVKHVNDDKTCKCPTGLVETFSGIQVPSVFSTFSLLCSESMQILQKAIILFKSMCTDVLLNVFSSVAGHYK